MRGRFGSRLTKHGSDSLPGGGGIARGGSLQRGGGGRNLQETERCVCFMIRRRHPYAVKLVAQFFDVVHFIYSPHDAGVTASL